MAMLPRPAAFTRRVSAAPDAPVTGIFLLIAAAILIPISDGFAKILTQDLPVAQVVWLRFGSQTLLILPIALWWHGRRIFQTAKPLTQALRSALITIAAFCFFSAITTIPLADTVAVFFINPFVITALSPWVLGERVGVWRWSAVAIGFLGMMILVRPGFETIEPGHLYAMAAGTAFALFAVVTRRLAGGDPPLVTTFLTGAGTLLLTSVVTPFVWVDVSMAHAGPIIGMGGIGCVFSILVILAYERASASQLAPFGYVEIAAAAAVGWIMFGDFPDALSWLGIAVIVASGIVIAWREARLARRDRPVASSGSEKRVS